MYTTQPRLLAIANAYRSTEVENRIGQTRAVGSVFELRYTCTVFELRSQASDHMNEMCARVRTVVRVYAV